MWGRAPRPSKPSEARQPLVAPATSASGYARNVAASNRLRNSIFFSAGKNDASNELRANSRRCSSVKPNASCTSPYSSTSEVRKHGRIVAVEGQHQALVEVAPHRMLRELGAATRPQIAGHADFNRNLSLGQLFDQFRILPGGKPVADAFRFEVQRAPDGLRPARFHRRAR